MGFPQIKSDYVLKSYNKNNMFMMPHELKSYFNMFECKQSGKK